MYGRKTAGPDTQVRLGVAVVIRDKRGRILLEKRRDSGMWGVCGGGIEPGETVRRTALREVKEETGLTVKITRLIGVYSNPADRIVTYPDNGDVRHLVDIFLEAIWVSGALKISEESLALEFFDPASLPKDLVPAARVPLRDVLDGNDGQVR